MTIKDFTVGQTVYILGEGRSRGSGQSVRTAKIVKVGRKYVTIDGAWKTKFEECGDDRYLSESKDWGAPRLLFPSQEAVDEYCEHEELRTWLRKATDWSRIGQYSLAQLRAVKKILEGKNIEAS